MKCIREVLLQVFENNGIFVNYNDFTVFLEMDSITYITLIVDIENAFGIQIPEDYLIYNDNCSFKMMEDIVNKAISNKGNVQ